MPKKLKCYTRQGKNGQYTTCNKDIAENKGMKETIKINTKYPKKRIETGTLNKGGVIKQVKPIKINTKYPKKRIETGTLNKGKVIKDAPKIKTVKKAVKKPVKKAVAKSKGTTFSTVRNPLDITKSAKIKKEIKTLLGNDNTLKMPSKDKKSITNKALLSVIGSRVGDMKTIKEVIKKYDKLPKNIKDNLALQLYGYEDILHKTFSNLKVFVGYDGLPFYRYYNP